VNRWWWCKDCQVKWYDHTGTCWMCESSMEDRRANSLAANIPPMLTSQMGSYV
jgi:hypothetical protein